MATHLAHNQEIEGSNPSPATIISVLLAGSWFIASKNDNSSLMIHSIDI